MVRWKPDAGFVDFVECGDSNEMAADAMATAGRVLVDPELVRGVNALRACDNRTNWYYLAREWLILIAVFGLSVAFYEFRASWGIPRGWVVPVTVLAVALIGACQHRLTTLGHEASHYMLFRDRRLNELVSDWFCMFPVFSTTQNYRIQHLAHHQHVNDPERDPDVAQMEASGHRFRFPMARRLFVWSCVVKQLLWPPGLVRYLLVRGRYAATGPGGQGRGSSFGLVLGLAIGYLVPLPIVLTWLGEVGDPWRLALVPAGMWLAALGVVAAVPGRSFATGPLRPEISPRWTLGLRITHLTMVLVAIAWLKHLTGRPWGLYCWLLWLLPLVTSFPFFMILRQVVQHGNADRGRLTNTRVFHVGALFRFAVFPLGMDYHLPHHLFPMVPHYRLRRLHALLRASTEYQQRATVVEGYFFPRSSAPEHPTVLDLMARPAP
jgi:fatty acid desaturase